ncbi:MAG: hypothetical protein HY815_13800 [Candidatus Riflebacteria bacterium]|nr:hypothetical protein [Candidatus Riflebacteria bacterium]
MSRPARHKKKQHAIRPVPDDRRAQAQADRGRNALEAGDLVTAARELGAAWATLKTDPVRSALLEVSRSLGRRFLEEGEYGQAVEHLRRVHELDRTDSEAVVTLSRLLWSSGDLSGTAAALGTLLERVPAHEWALPALVLVCLRQGRLDSAEVLLARWSGEAQACGAGPTRPEVAALIRLATLATRAASGTGGAMVTAGPSRASVDSFISTLEANHKALIREFVPRVERSLLERLETVRRELAAELVSPTPGKSAQELDPAAIVPTLAPLVDQLVGAVAETLARRPFVCPPTWETPAARLVLHLVHGSRPGVAAEPVPLDPQTPELLRTVLDVLCKLAAGQAVPALETLLHEEPVLVPAGLTELLVGRALRTMRAPPGPVRSPVSPAGERIDDSTVRIDSPLLYRLARHRPPFAPSLRLELLRMLIEAREPEGALELAGSLPDIPPADRVRLATMLEQLGRPEETLPHWEALLDAELGDDRARGPAPSWVPVAVFRVAARLDSKERQRDLERFLRRAAGRFPDSFHVRLARAIDAASYVEPDEACVDALVASPPQDPLMRTEMSRVLIDMGRVREGLDLIRDVVNGPSPTRDARDLEELALLDWLDDHPSARAALPLLRERRQRRGVNAILAMRESDLEEAWSPGGGRELLELALDLASSDAVGAIDIGAWLGERHDAPLALRFLRTVRSLAGLDPWSAAECVCRLIACGDLTRGERLLDAHLDTLGDDTSRLTLLALIVIDLYERCKGDLEVALDRLVLRTRRLELTDHRLLQALVDLKRGDYGECCDEAGYVPGWFDRALAVLRAHQHAHEPPRMSLRERLAPSFERAARVFGQELVAAVPDRPAPEARTGELAGLSGTLTTALCLVAGSALGLEPGASTTT